VELKIKKKKFCMIYLKKLFVNNVNKNLNYIIINFELKYFNIEIIIKF